MSTTESSPKKMPASTSDRGSQLRAENRSVEVDGDSLMYRRFGNAHS